MSNVYQHATILYCEIKKNKNKLKGDIRSELLSGGGY